MKATDILEVLSREAVSGDKFGVIYVHTPMLYADFVKLYLWHDFKRRGTCDDVLISGDVFYCWSDTLLDFADSEDLEVMEISGEYLYVIEVD